MDEHKRDLIACGILILSVITIFVLAIWPFLTNLADRL